MKHILSIQLLFIVLLACNAPRKVSSENHSDPMVARLTTEALKLMKELNIETRDSLHLDGPLRIKAVDFTKNPKQKNWQGQFERYNIGSRFNRTGKVLVAYEYPVIDLSLFVDSALQEKKDTSRFVEVLVESTLIHELVHFLQKPDSNYPSDVSTLKLREYFNLKDENEAFAVCAYYFLKKYEPATLRRLSSFKKDHKEYRSQLFEAYILIIRQNAKKFKIPV